MNKQRLKDLAFSLMDSSSKKRCHHFSFIMHKGRIISIGQNNTKTHPINLINRKTSSKTGKDFSNEKHTCSEFNAILKFRKLTNINSSKCSIVNIRIDRNNNLAFAKPCMSCESLLKYFEFKNIYWSDHTGEIVKHIK
jgi:hypothetical protein